MPGCFFAGQDFCPFLFYEYRLAPAIVRAGLAPDEQRQVWRDLIGSMQAAFNSGKPFRLTAKAIKAAVNKYTGGQIAKCVEAATKSSKKSKYHRSEKFVAAFDQFVAEIVNEAQAEWLNTSRQVVFEALCALSRAVGESGRESTRTKGLVWRGNNAEKLLAAGFSIFRISPDNLLIERLVAADQWLMFGEYKTAEQGLAAFDDLMLEPANLQMVE